MSNLIQNFNQSKPHQKYYLISVLVALFSTFLPWLTVTFGIYGAAHFSAFTFLGSILALTLWLLRTYEVKLPHFPLKDQTFYQIFAILILAGPILTIFQHHFQLNFMSLGFYLALLTGATATYFSFQTK